MSGWRLTAIISVFLSVSIHSSGADTRRVKASYTYVIPENVTMEQARGAALRRAMADAIAAEFGTMVTQASTTMLSNLNGISSSDFFSTGSSEVNGEWIRTTKEPEYLVEYSDGMLAVTVRVEGIVRSIDYAPVTIKVTLPPDASRCDETRDVFHSGDNLYVKLQVPVDGFAAIYLVGNDRKAYRLMPHPDTPGYAQHISRRSPQLYFYRPQNDDSEFFYCAEGSAPELNRVYVLFSPTEFVLPHEEAPVIDESGVIVPPGISLPDFTRWVSDNRLRDRKFQCSITDVMILPPSLLNKPD